MFESFTSIFKLYESIEEEKDIIQTCDLTDWKEEFVILHYKKDEYELCENLIDKFNYYYYFELF